MSIYQRMFGFKRIINASGTMTLLGGSLMPPEVIQAMSEAAEDWVKLDELLEKAGQIIADIADVPACLITSGSAAAITLATAACITGKNREKMIKLPDTDGMKNEIIWQNGHYPAYASQFKAAGGKLVVVGREPILIKVPEVTRVRTLPAFRILGCTRETVETAITERTCALAYTQAHFSVHEGLVSLKEYCEIAHEHELPVIVDAASELPPVSNLGWFYDQGADLTCFSGGKAMYGPNDTGFLLGDKNLIEAATMQANPRSGIGRGFKVSKEQIVGLVVAVQRYANLDEKARLKEEMDRAEYIVNSFKDYPHVNAQIIYPDNTGLPVPRVWLTLNEKTLGITVDEVSTALREGEPSIYTREHYSRTGMLLIDVQVMRHGEEKIVAEKLKEVLS
ncbi:MAG: aminotransferase class V-fold PLP-dependent enzyme [Candidatus Bathyarchaeia archaeon]